jgi:thioredoxin reductase (NADPH)
MPMSSHATPDAAPAFGADFVPEAHLDEPVAPPLIDVVGRRHQIFPILTAAEIARLRRFGAPRCWHDGARIFTAGQTTLGMLVVLSGEIAVSRRDGRGDGRRVVVTSHGPGSFSGEVAQLANRPALVDGHAVGAVEALVISSESLRALVVAEAELGERIMRALILRRVGLIDTDGSNVLLVGPAGNAALFTLQSFLSANGQPYTLRHPGADSEADELVRLVEPGEADWPLVLCPDGSVKKNPSPLEIGLCLGMMPVLNADTVFDVLVVGAGPAGLATAVYAASEGLSVLVLEQRAYGGQAGASARIENYLGFPTGVSGRALAGRAFVQAQKFGAEIAVPATAARLLCDRYPLQLTLADGGAVQARSVVLACGARYRQPGLANLKQFEGRGIYYWASPIEAKLCRNEEVILVGGGNSAGQAAVFLAGHAARVHMVIRGAGLAATMSAYLIERIKATPNISLHPHTEITALEGDEQGLCRAHWKNRDSGEECDAAVRRLFLFVGADPNTAWLGDCGVGVDDKGFIRTGFDVTRAQCRANGHYPDDGPVRAALETSVPGVFAIGDVRANSTKRVAAAVGEGAAVVAQLHAYLAHLPVTPVAGVPR